MLKPNCEVKEFKNMDLKDVREYQKTANAIIYVSPEAAKCCL